MINVANGIWVDGHGDAAYEQQTVAILSSVLATGTGQAIQAIVRAHGMIVVEPYTASDEVNAGARNAYADANNVKDVSKLDTGTGGTKVAYIHFSANEMTKAVVLLPPYYIPTVSVPPVTGPGSLPDEVLFHEMVHIGRVMGGDFNQIPLAGPMSNYTDEEDFFAIMVANIYISEKGRPQLRDSHVGFTALASQFSTSEVFLYRDDDYRLIEKYCKQHPVAAPMLAKVNAAFNPIRAYYDLRLYGPAGPPPPVAEDIIKTTAVARDSNFVGKPSAAGTGLSDSLLISILAPRFRANDVAGYGGRAKHFEQVLQGASASDAAKLLNRLEVRARGDKVAALFHDHLATATRQTCLGILRNRK